MEQTEFIPKTWVNVPDPTQLTEEELALIPRLDNENLNRIELGINANKNFCKDIEAQTVAQFNKIISEINKSLFMVKRDETGQALMLEVSESFGSMVLVGEGISFNQSVERKVWEDTILLLNDFKFNLKGRQPELSVVLCPNLSTDSSFNVKEIKACIRITEEDGDFGSKVGLLSRSESRIEFSASEIDYIVENNPNFKIEVIIEVWGRADKGYFNTLKMSPQLSYLKAEREVITL